MQTTLKNFLLENNYLYDDTEIYDESSFEQESEYCFEYNCTSPYNYEELEFICNNMIECTGDEFLEHVSLKEINNSLQYNIKYETEDELKNDLLVKFNKFNTKLQQIYYDENGNYFNIDAYILIQSAIEYIYKKY